MKCDDCGFENPAGIYRCQRCGNSLIPTIPRETYINPIPPKKKKKSGFSSRSASIIIFVVGVMAVFFLCLVFLIGAVNAIFSSSNSGASVAYEASEDVIAESVDEVPEPGFNPEEYISQGKMTLPESTITIGLPEYDSWEEDYYSSGADYSCVFYLTDGNTLRMYSYTVVSPFSKSEEEEYFKEDRHYLRLEGSNDQYFYTVSNDGEITATVVDRKIGRNYVLTLVPEQSGETESEQQQYEKRAIYLMDNTILDQSSMAAEKNP